MTGEQLGTPWGFWQDHWEHGAGGGKVQSLVDLGVASTATAFWTLYERHSIAQLKRDCSLHIFRHHVKPEWEDPANVNGGHFRLLPNPERTDAQTMQRRVGHLWFDLVRALVRGDFADSTAIVGIAVTNKAFRQVVSLWTRTTEPAVIATIQHDLLTQTLDSFSIKFVPHKRIAKADFTTQQTRMHRRTRSAPEKYLSVDEDDDDAALQGATPAAPATETTSPVSPNTSLFARRGIAAQSLQSDGMRVNTVVTPPPEQRPTMASRSPEEVATLPPSQPPAARPAATHCTPGKGRAAGETHHRSKSDGQSRSVIPANPKMARYTCQSDGGSGSSGEHLPPATPPGLAAAAAGLQPPALQQERSLGSELSGASMLNASNELRGSDSGPYLPTPMVAAPSPMKDWSVGWSPSLLHARNTEQEQQQRLMQERAKSSPGSRERQDPISPPKPSPTAQPTTQPIFVTESVFTVDQQQQRQQQVQQQVQQRQHTQPAQTSHFATHVTATPFHVASQQHAPVPGMAPPAMVACHAPVQPYTLVHVTPVVVPQSYPQHHHSSYGAHAPSERQQRLIIGTVKPPPAAPAPPPKSSSATHPPAGPAQRSSSSGGGGGGGSGERQVPIKSDAAAFVSKGWLYPPGLNRKERRRVIFAAEGHVPGDVPGAVHVGEDVPDGAVDCAAEYEKLRARAAGSGK